MCNKLRVGLMVKRSEGSDKVRPEKIQDWTKGITMMGVGKG